MSKIPRFKELRSDVCPYSPDCFTCPLDDCKCPMLIINTANVLPLEHLFIPGGKEPTAKEPRIWVIAKS